ncbi:hypothetical protein [Shewanella gaetbuli]
MRLLFSVVIVTILIVLNVTLLLLDKLTGTDFVLFFTVSVVVGFVVWFQGKITELSFKGYVVKMQQENKKAERLISELEVLARDTFKVHMSQYSSMHDSHEELALHDAKKFFECCELYLKYQNVLHLEADQDFPQIIEGEVRKYLVGTVLYTDAQNYFGIECTSIPSPEDLVRKYSKNNNRFDSSPYYTFYKDDLYPLYIKHRDHSTDVIQPTSTSALVNEGK